MNNYLKMAIANISKKGDTDIFPFPIENAIFYDKADEIEEIISEMDKNLEKHLKANSVENIKTCIPVGYIGFRWATLIDPAWNALFLAQVLKIAEQIESKRIPIEENTIFSYRFNYDEENGFLFDKDIRWKAFYKTAGEIASDFKFVLTFDISDFYNRVNHERLRSVLNNDIGADGNTVDRIIKLLSEISDGNDSYGLPIGGNASRILAEAFLTRADNFLKERGIKFCRFVDDFILFANKKDDAYELLNSCANYFLKNLGLSLAKNKTSIMTSAEFKKHIKMVFDEVEGEKDDEKNAIIKLNMNFDPYSAATDDTLNDIKDQVDGSVLIKLLKSEIRKTKINQLFGKQLIGAVRSLNDEDISEAFQIISANFDKLYPVFPLIMRTAYHNLARCNEKAFNAFTGSVIQLFEENSYIIQTDNNASYAIRLLSVARNAKAVKVIRKLYENQRNGQGQKSELIKVNAVYALTNIGDHEWLEERLEEFPRLTQAERRALVAATAFMGEKGETWLKTFQNYLTPLESLTGKWAFRNRNSKENWRLPL